MLASEIWEINDSFLYDVHIPIDSYIIDAAKGKEYFNKNAVCCTVYEKSLPCTICGETLPNPLMKWSKMSYSEYIRFQNHIRNAIKNEQKNKSFEYPIEWEFHVWQKQADTNKKPFLL